MGGDALQKILQGFFWKFDEYERAFGGKVRQNMNSFKEGVLHDQIEVLYAKTKGPNAISEKEIGEELFMIPMIPHEELEELKLQWKSGKKRSVIVFSRLQEMYAKSMMPSWWLRMGAKEQEDADAAEEGEIKGSSSGLKYR